MSNSKATREAILRQAGWREVKPGRWLPDGLFCMSCGKYSKPEDANDNQCGFCGGNLAEVQQ